MDPTSAARKLGEIIYDHPLETTDEDIETFAQIAEYLKSLEPDLEVMEMLSSLGTGAFANIAEGPPGLEDANLNEAEEDALADKLKQIDSMMEDLEVDWALRGKGDEFDIYRENIHPRLLTESGFPHLAKAIKVLDLV